MRRMIEEAKARCCDRERSCRAIFGDVGPARRQEFSSGRQEGGRKEKSPAVFSTAGLRTSSFNVPVGSLSAPAGRGQKSTAEKSPLSRLGVSRLHEHQMSVGWNVGVSPPAEPRGRRVDTRSASFRTASK